MRWAVAWLGLVACRAGDAGPADAPREDAVAAIDAPPIADAPPGLPDLVLVGPEIAGTPFVATEYFGPDACELAEGCIGAAGVRRLLRFDAVTANQGTADLVLGATPPPGVSNGVFVWSACHQHHHVPGFEDYALVGPGGVITAGHKQAYCLRDDEREQAGAPSQGYGCTFQGISAGWADVYQTTLPCQWIDVTGVAPGIYTLRITVNPTQKFPESDVTNDVFETQVVL